MMTKGILLLGKDEVVSGRARTAGIEVVIGNRPELLWDKTLIVAAGTRIPFRLLPAAWGFLERWDAAVPLWRYDVTAASTGSAFEREFTRIAIRELRVLLHAIELLFVRRNEAGEALVAAWLAEIGRFGDEVAGDKRLAFLRAFYEVKPRLCVLPVSWLVENQKPSVLSRARRSPNGGKPLISVELEPGRFVKVHAGDEDRVRTAFERQRFGRKDGVIMATVSSKSFEVVNEKVRRSKGPLVKVEISPGRFVKMYRADAEKQGLVEPVTVHVDGQQELGSEADKKERPPSGNKMRPPGQDKKAPAADTAEGGGASASIGSPSTGSGAAGDDLSTIEGVGPATVRALGAAGIVSFEGLKTADVSKVLSGPALAAVEKWRSSEQAQNQVQNGDEDE